MKYVSQGPLMVDVHMHKPQTNAKNFMDALLAFWPGLQVLFCLFSVCWQFAVTVVYDCCCNSCSSRLITTCLLCTCSCRQWSDLALARRLCKLGLDAFSPIMGEINKSVHHLINYFHVQLPPFQTAISCEFSEN